MNVYILLIEISLHRKSKVLGVRSEPGAGRFGGLSHHIPQRTGQFQTALPRHRGGLHKQDISAGRSPSQSNSDARLRILLNNFRLEFDRPQQLGQIIRDDPNRTRFLALSDPSGHLATNRSDFPLEIPNACLPGVALNQGNQSLFLNLKIEVPDAVLLDLTGQQESLRNLNFLFKGVPRQFNDFHPIAQSGWNRINQVGGRHKEHL